MRCSLDRQTNAYRWFPRRQKHTCKPSRRPNSVLMISSHLVARCGSFATRELFGSRMTRTMWIALFCLVTSGASIAIRVASPPESGFVEAAPHQSKIWTGPVPDEATKSDRLELPDIRADTETGETEMVPPAQPVPVDPPNKPETTRIPSQRWQDANAKIAPSAPSHRRPVARGPKRSADSNPPMARAEAWHCRQDAMGSLLRSLDLSPRCNL
jgi:hypothetical protein